MERSRLTESNDKRKDVYVPLIFNCHQLKRHLICIYYTSGFCLLSHFMADDDFIFEISPLNLLIFSRLVSAMQAVLSSSAGAIVSNSSCRRSFLSASHFMSDGYAWFGAAYFIYDLWHMYRVHVYKVNDKILLNNATITLSSTDNENVAESKNGHNNNGKSNFGASNETDHLYLNHVIECNGDIFASRLRNVSDRHINFIQFCLLNPVMFIHHVFLGSFGLFVIVVSSPTCSNSFSIFFFLHLFLVTCSIFEATLEIVCTVLFS